MVFSVLSTLLCPRVPIVWFSFYDLPAVCVAHHSLVSFFTSYLFFPFVSLFHCLQPLAYTSLLPSISFSFQPLLSYSSFSFFLSTDTHTPLPSFIFHLCQSPWSCLRESNPPPNSSFYSSYSLSDSRSFLLSPPPCRAL